MEIFYLILGMAYDDKEEIRITGVNPDLKIQIENIAAYKGVPASAFLRLQLREIVDATPEHMKKPPRKN